MPATLDLRFEPNSEGATILRIKQQQPPWRVVRGFTTPSGETLVHLNNVSGGILDSDELNLRVDLAAGAKAQLTTTGATRVYRSRSQQHSAKMRGHVTLGENAYLEYLPDQLIPYAGSRLDQITLIELSRGASLVWWERIVPGREAAGEMFQYERLTSHFEVIAEEEPIAIEHWSLEPALRPLTSNARLGPFRHFASCYICRAGDPSSYWKALETALQTIASRLSNPELILGVSPLRAHGLAIRCVALSERPLVSALVEIWTAAKWNLCGRVATLPRKIH